MASLPRHVLGLGISEHSDDTSSDYSETTVASICRQWYLGFYNMKLYLQQHQQHQMSCNDVFRFFLNTARPGLDEDFVNVMRVLESVHPWVMDFVNTNGIFENSTAIYKAEPRKFVSDLSTYIEGVYCTVIQHYHRTLDPKKLDVIQSKYEINIPGVSVAEKEENESFRLFCCALHVAESEIYWLNTQNRVKRFAQIIGYQVLSQDNSEQDVFRYINFLEGKAFETTHNQQITALEAKIDILAKEKDAAIEKLSMQKRIVASLTFRHILEKLPPMSTKNESHKWDEFWKKAVSQSVSNKESPLSKMVENYARHDKDPTKPPDVNDIKRAGGLALYSAFSTNIHQYKGEYALQRDQWHELEWEILNAIKPLPENIHANGSVDWAKERERFDPPVPASSTATATTATPTPASAPGPSTTPNPSPAPATSTTPTPPSASGPTLVEPKKGTSPAKI